MLHEDTATLFSNYNNSPVSFDLYTDKWKVGISKPLQWHTSGRQIILTLDL